MHARNFDTLTRRLVTPRSRRAFVAAIGAAFFARSAGAAAPAAQVPAACGAAGDVCTLALGCCDGMTCATSYMNPSYGVCVSGGSGGMLPVADSVISPEGDGIETQLQAALSTTSLTSTTTSSTTTDKQTRRDAKQSKRSSRRSTRKSTNNTQQTNRKSRRDTHQLNQPAQLILESFTNLPNTGDETDGFPTEALRVSNVDNVTVTVSSVSATINPALTDTVSVSISPGSSYLLLSGVSGDDAPTPSSTLATIWTESFVCRDANGAIDGAGYTIVALQSGGTTSSEFSVLCNQIQSYAGTGNGNNNQNNHRQQAKRRRHRRQQQKQQHKNNGGK